MSCLDVAADVYSIDVGVNTQILRAFRLLRVARPAGREEPCPSSASPAVHRAAGVEAGTGSQVDEVIAGVADRPLDSRRAAHARGDERVERRQDMLRRCQVRREAP